MDQKYNISEILDAVNDIHRSEPKKKTNELCLLRGDMNP